MAVERQIKEYFLKMLKTINAHARKITYENRNGCPDWLVAHKGVLYLAELKSGVGKLTKIQSLERDRYLCKGVPVSVIGTYDQVDDFVDMINE